MNGNSDWKLAMDNFVQPFATPTLSASGGSATTYAGQAANRAVAASLFADYRQRHAQKTIRTQTATLLPTENPTPPTPQGIRDRLLLCLLLYPGLRASEGAGLQVANLAEPGYVTVYRQKTDTTDRMELMADILATLASYQRYMRQSGALVPARL